MVSIDKSQSENECMFFAVYDSSCSKLVLDSNEKVASFHANKFEEYHIYSNVGIVLNWREYEDCSCAKEVESFPFSYKGNTNGYPYVEGECTDQVAQGIWFKFAGNGKKIFISLIENYVGDKWGALLEVYKSCRFTYAGTCVNTVESYDDLGSMIILDTTSDDTYYVFAGSRKPGSGGINFTLTMFLYDTNDNSRCEQGTVIPKLPYSFSGTTLDKSYSNLTCREGVYEQRKGSWFRYVHKMIEPQMVSVSTCNRGMNMLNAKIEVYQNCSENVCVAEENYTTRIKCSMAIFKAYPKHEYNIYITAEDASSPGDYYHVDFSYMSVKPQENCSRITEYKLLPFAMMGYTIGSSPSWDECSGEYRQGYWVLVIGNGKPYYATTRGDQTIFETSISVYDHCPNRTKNPTCIAHNESDGDSLDTSVMWETKNKHLYYIFVSGRNGTTGIFTLKVFEAYTPVNSKCLTPISVSKASYKTYASTMYSNYTSTSCTSNVTRKGVWYSIYGGSNWVHLSTCDPMTDFSTAIEVYVGCNIDENKGAGCVPVRRDGSCDSKDVVSFRGLKNTYYWVYVTARENAEPRDGFFVLNVTSGAHFHVFDKPIIFYVSMGYLILFGFFSCIGLIVAIISLVFGCIRRSRVGYLKIVN